MTASNKLKKTEKSLIKSLNLPPSFSAFPKENPTPSSFKIKAGMRFIASGHGGVEYEITNISPTGNRVSLISTNCLHNRYSVNMGLTAMLKCVNAWQGEPLNATRTPVGASRLNDAVEKATEPARIARTHRKGLKTKN